MINKTPVQPFREELVCDECGCAMEFSGWSYPTNPPQYQYMCPECGRTENTTITYPRIVYEADSPEEEPNER